MAHRYPPSEIRTSGARRRAREPSSRAESSSIYSVTSQSCQLSSPHPPSPGGDERERYNMYNCVSVSRVGTGGVASLRRWYACMTRIGVDGRARLAASRELGAAAASLLRESVYHRLTQPKRSRIQQNHTTGTIGHRERTDQGADPCGLQGDRQREGAQGPRPNGAHRYPQPPSETRTSGARRRAREPSSRAESSFFLRSIYSVTRTELCY